MKRRALMIFLRKKRKRRLKLNWKWKRKKFRKLKLFLESSIKDIRIDSHGITSIIMGTHKDHSAA